MSDSSPRPSSRRRRGLWRWIVLAVILAAAAGWAYVNRPWEPKPLIVPVEAVQPGPASRVLAVNGRVVPAKQVEISATVSGRVESVSVEDGDEVAEGAVLLTIDDAQQQAVVAQAQSALASAEAKLQQAKVDYERARGLGDSISQKALADANLAVETAQSEVDRLTANRDQALSLLAEYTVKAPFAGTVLSRGADPGQVVSNATSLFLFAELSDLRAEATIDELYATEVKRGLKVRAQPSGHSRVLEGEVVYIAPRVDATTGGRTARVDLPEAAGLSLPVGLTVTLNILVDERESAITIPRAALAEGSAPAVYLLEGDTAVRREIQFIDWPSDRLIVISGLEAGDRLIANSARVTEGGLVAAEE